MPGIAAESASFLNALQPLAGAALALNLAYLSLRQFFHPQNTISEAAGECLEAVRAKENYNPSQEKADYFRELQYLAALPDDGADGEESGRSNAGRNKRPDKLWARTYAALYIPSWDIKFCAAAVVVSTIAFILDSGHSAGLLDFIEPLFKSEQIVLAFWLLLAVCTTAPIVFFAAGYYVLRSALKYIRYTRGQIAFFIKEDADEAEYPRP